MSKILIRIVTFFLVPCLTADPSLAVVIPRDRPIHQSFSDNLFQQEALVTRMVTGFHKAKDRLSARIIHFGPRLEPATGSLEYLPNRDRAENTFSWDQYRPHKSLKDRLSSIFLMKGVNDEMGGASESSDEHELLNTIEQASHPIDDDLNIEARVFTKQCWEQAIRYYDAILGLMQHRGLFADQTLIVPASGVDAFMAYYAPTIAIDHHDLERPALDLAERETNRSREAYANNFAFKFGSAFHPEYFSDNVHTRHKTMFLKGAHGYLRVDRGGVRSYFDSIDQFLNPGDRVILLLQEDRIIIEPELRRRGWVRLENWLSSDETSRLRTAINRMATDPKNQNARTQLNYAHSFFEVPTDIVIYEKPVGARPGTAYETPENVLSSLALVAEDVFLDVSYARGHYAEAAIEHVKQAIAVIPRSSVEVQLPKAVVVANTLLEVPSNSVDKLASIDWAHTDSKEALSFARQIFRVIAKYKTERGWETGLIHFRTDDWEAQKSHWMERFQEAAPGAQVEILEAPTAIGGILFRWRMESTVTVQIDQMQQVRVVNDESGSSSRSRIEDNVLIYEETSPWGWSRWDDPASHYVLVGGQEARPMAEGQKITRFNEETKQYEVLVAHYLKNELVWVRVAIGQTIEEAEQRVTISHENQYAWYYEQQHVNTQVDQREVVYVRLYNLDMTWLANLTTKALKPFAKGATEAEKSNWVYDRRIRVVPAIEQSLNLLVNTLFPHLGWLSALVPATVFGERHTGRTIGFQIFAGAWGCFSLMAVHGTAGFQAGPIHGWVFQLVTTFILFWLQTRWNIRARGYQTIDALWRIMTSGNALRVLSMYRRMRQSHDRPDLPLFDHAFSRFYKDRIWVVEEMVDLFPLYRREGTSWAFSPSNTLSAIGMFADAPDFFLRAGFQMTRSLLSGTKPRDPGGLWFFDIGELWNELKNDLATLETRVNDLKERLEDRVQSGGSLSLLGHGSFDAWQSILVGEHRWHPGVDYTALLQDCQVLVLGDTNHGALGIIRGLIDHLAELKAAGVSHLALEIPSDIPTDDTDVHKNTWISHRFRQLVDSARGSGIEIVFMDMPRDQRKLFSEREMAYQRGIYMGNYLGTYVTDLLNRNPQAKVVAATGYSHMSEFNQIPKQLGNHHVTYRSVALITEGTAVGAGDLFSTPGFVQAVTSVSEPGRRYGFVGTSGLSLDAYRLYGVIYFPRPHVEAPLASPIHVELPATGLNQELSLRGGPGTLVPITPGQISRPIHLTFEPHFRQPVQEVMEENERKLVECVWRLDGLSPGQRIYLAALLFAYARDTDFEHTIYGSFGGPLISVGFVPEYQFFEFRARDYDGYWAPRQFEISLEDLQRKYGFADFLNSDSLKNIPSIDISNNPERPISAIRLIPLVLTVLTGNHNRITLTTELYRSKHWLKVFRDPVDSVPSGPNSLQQLQLVTYLGVEDFTLTDLEKSYLEAKTRIAHLRQLIGYPMLTDTGYGFRRFSEPRRNWMSLPRYLMRKGALVLGAQLRLGHATYQALRNAESGPGSLVAGDSLESQIEAFILQARQNLRSVNRQDAEGCLVKLDNALSVANTAISSVDRYFGRYPQDAHLVGREEHYVESDRRRIPELRRQIEEEQSSERREGLRHNLESTENQLKTGQEMLVQLRTEYNALLALRQRIAAMVRDMQEPPSGITQQLPNPILPSHHSGLPENRPEQKRIESAA